MLKLSPQLATLTARVHAEQAQRIRVSVAGCVALLLVCNCVSFYGAGSDLWASPTLLVGLLGLFLFGNSLLLPGRLFSMANIFLLLLSLFHLGYYVPARLGLVRALPYMPPVFGYGPERVLTVFCAAALALELGCLLASLYCGRILGQSATGITRSEWSTTALCCGWIISSASLLAQSMFVVQVGGLSAMLRTSYADLFTLLSIGDSRFAFTGMWYAPVGLLLWRAGLMCNEASSSRAARRCWWMAVFVLLATFLVIGSRGPAFLFVIGFVYLRHLEEERLSNVKFIAVAAALTLAAPLIISYRNLDFGERTQGMAQAQVGLSAFLIEIGSTYRPYYGIVEMMDSGQQEYFQGQSYWVAVKGLLPNFGASDRGQPDGYYRTNTWFNQRLSPIDSSRNIGIGCSMIAEQYANFGYSGVLGIFAMLGFGIVLFESRAVVCRSALSRAVLAIVVVPLCWYIRDDIFGTLRMFVWPLLTMVLVRILRLPVSSRCTVSNLGAGSNAGCD